MRRSAVHGGHRRAGPVPAAAALAYAKAGLALPPLTVVPTAAALAFAGEWRTPWADGGALDEALKRLDAGSADALAAALLDVGSPPAGRVGLAGALLSRFRAKRSAPPALMPGCARC